jgi:hypothetical protein
MAAPGRAAPPVDGPANFGMQQAGVGLGVGAPPGMGAMVPAPGTGATGRHGPVGNMRNPIAVFLIGAVCFLYWLFVLWSTLSELKAFRQKDDINAILYFIPIINLIAMWGLPAKVLEAKQMAGVPNATVSHPILYLFFWPYFFTADLNEIWQAAGGQR